VAESSEKPIERECWLSKKAAQPFSGVQGWKVSRRPKVPVRQTASEAVPQTFSQGSQAFCALGPRADRHIRMAAHMGLSKRSAAWPHILTERKAIPVAALTEDPLAVECARCCGT
jgi:hypothetical protein